jgi:hypothetical protein
LHAYLTLFLHSQDASGLPVFDTKTSEQISLPQHNYNELCSTIINTYALGEHVGREWQLERIMRWTPAHVSRPLETWEDLLSAGFIANRNFTTTGLRPAQSPWCYSRSDSGRGIPSIRAFSLIRPVSRADINLISYRVVALPIASSTLESFPSSLLYGPSLLAMRCEPP